MTQPVDSNAKNIKNSASLDAKQERLAKALRRNLLRRKAVKAAGDEEKE